MEIVTGYTGEAHITAADDAAFHTGIFGKGDFVLSTGNKLIYDMQSNNLIKIKDGDIVFQGRHARIRQNMTDDCIIENGTQGMKRHDLIVARYKKEVDGKESVTTTVIKGTPGLEGSDPEHNTGDLFSGATEYDMLLYRVVLSGITIQQIDQLFNVMPNIRRIRSGTELPDNGIEGDIFLLEEV